MQVNCMHVSTVQIKSFDTKSLINKAVKADKGIKKLNFSSNEAILQVLSIKFKEA